MLLTPSSYFASKFVDVDQGLDYYVNLMNNTKRYDDNALIIYESPLKLVHQALLKVSAQLVAVELRSEWKDFHPGSLGVSQVREWTQNMHTKETSYRWKTLDRSQFPSQILCEMVPLMESIAEQVYSWIKDHESMIENVVGRFVDELLPAIVWRWDGRVNYNQTDVKLMLGTKLTDEEKFKIMCALCLDSDIAELYKSDDWLNTLKADGALMANVHVFYWDFYFENAIIPIPLINYEGTYAKYMLDHHVFSAYALDWYYSVCCTRAEQLDFCANQIMQLNSFDVKHLIMGMSEKEQKELFESRTLGIINIFIRDNCFDFALQLWNYVKDSMPGLQFTSMMYKQVLKINVTEDQMDHKYETDRCMEFAKYVWESAPRHLKEYFIEYQNGSLIFEWESWFGEDLYRQDWDSLHYLRDDNLLLAILSDADAKFRRQFWMDEWPWLVIGSRAVLLRKLMIICLRDREEISKYERLILDSSPMNRYLGRIFTRFHFDELNLFLDILAPDANRRVQAKIRMITEFTELPPFILMCGKISERELHGLADFFRDVDEESKMKFLSVWVDKWYARKYTYTYLKHRLIYDNMVDVLQALCDDQQRQILNQKMPSYEEFIRKVEVDRAEEDPENEAENEFAFL